MTVIPGPMPARVEGSSSELRGVRRWLAVSSAGLAVQVAATDYGPDGAAVAALWFVMGCVLLWLVYRHRSRVARGVVIVTSLLGAVLYTLTALGGSDSAPLSILLALAFLAQAIPLLLNPIRSHVHGTRSDQGALQ